MSFLAPLVSLLRPRLDAATYIWLRVALDEMLAPLDTRAFRGVWSLLGRRLGSQPITLSADETEHLQRAGLWPFFGWGTDECGRAALLMQALDITERERHGPLLDSLFLRGTIRERQALLRVLAYLPEPERHIELATQACRSPVVPVFQSLALDNPYPARHLARPHFDQMVQKAVVLKLGSERIVGLSSDFSAGSRRTPVVPGSPAAAGRAAVPQEAS